MESKKSNSEDWCWSNMMRKKLESVVPLDNMIVQNPSRYIDALNDHLINMCVEVAEVTEDFLNSVAEELTSYVTGPRQEESKVASADCLVQKKRTNIVAEDPISFASQEHFIRDIIEKSKLAFENVHREVLTEKTTVVVTEQGVESKITNSEGLCASISSEVATSLPSSPCLVQEDILDTSCKRSSVECVQVTTEPCQCASDEVAFAADNTPQTAETSETLSNDDAVVTNLETEEFEDVQLEDCMKDLVNGELTMQNANSCSYKHKFKSAFVSRIHWSKKKTPEVSSAQIGSYAKSNETSSLLQRQSKRLPQIKDSADDSDWEIL